MRNYENIKTFSQKLPLNRSYFDSENAFKRGSILQYAFTAYQSIENDKKLYIIENIGTNFY